MTIEKTINGAELIVTLAGRLDTITAPQLETELKVALPGVEHLVLDFEKLDYLFFPGIREAVSSKAGVITGYVVREKEMIPFDVTLGELTDEEREIILDGCLINYNRRSL